MWKFRKKTKGKKYKFEPSLASNQLNNKNLVRAGEYLFYHIEKKEEKRNWENEEKIVIEECCVLRHKTPSKRKFNKRKKKLCNKYSKKRKEERKIKRKVKGAFYHTHVYFSFSRTHTLTEKERKKLLYSLATWSLSLLWITNWDWIFVGRWW